MSEPQVLVYARVSTSVQEDGNVADTQVAACTEYARSLGYTEDSQVRVVRDTGSGADPDRAGLQDVWALAETGKVDCMVAYVPDRVARNPVHIMMFRERITELGSNSIS